MESTNLPLENQISKSDSMRITSLRFLLAVIVVFIHNGVDADTAINYYNLDWNEPNHIIWLKFIICNFFGNACVPIFFLFAGFLQFQKDDEYSVLLKKRAKTIVTPFVLWTLLNVLLIFIAQQIPSFSSLFYGNSNIVKNWTIADWINLFWTHINASYPLIGPFWFLRDLILLIIISPVLKFFARKMPFVSGIIIILCYFKGLPLGFGTALFFYMSGFYFSEYKVSFFSIADKITWLEYILLMILFIIITKIFSVFINFGTIICCLFFFKLSGLIIKNNKLYIITEYLANFSFFLYAIHTPLIEIPRRMCFYLIPLHGEWYLFQFLIPCFLTIVVGTGFGILLKRLCPMLFRFLNGGR